MRMPSLHMIVPLTELSVLTYVSDLDAEVYP